MGRYCISFFCRLVTLTSDIKCEDTCAAKTFWTNLNLRAICLRQLSLIPVLQVLTDAEAPLPSGAKLAVLLQRHEAGYKSIDYRLFLTGAKYTRKSWRLIVADEDQKPKGKKLKSLRRRPAPLFICRRPTVLPRGGNPSQEDPPWQPPYVELYLSDVRPINVERSGHVCSDDRAWYANRYEYDK